MGQRHIQTYSAVMDGTLPDLCYQSVVIMQSDIRTHTDLEVKGDSWEANIVSAEEE